MKLKHYLFATALIGLAVTAASCSDDKDSRAPAQSNAIRFAAQSSSLSRAVTTTQNLSEFSVYAYTEGLPFMQNVTVSKTSDNTWTYSPTQYWPATPVNFYAFAPLNWGAQSTDPNAPIDYYAEYGNTDLIYSVLKGQTQTAGPVTFNFRHALSQVLVNLRTDMADKFDIKVSEVYVNGLKTKGSFTFPTESTTAGSSSVGTWSNLEGSSTYIYFMDSTPMVLSPEAQAANVVSQGLVLPQDLTLTTMTPTEVTGDVIAVDLVIYDKSNGNQIWPNETTPPVQNINNQFEKTGRLFFPVVTGNITNWEPGTRYIYNITINEPLGIQEIQFGQPTVDSYTEVTVVPDAATI